MNLLKRNKKIAVSVFCGSRLGNKPEYSKLATELGALIAKNDMRLIYGAGGRGLMGSVANGVLENNGDIYGITTNVIADFEKPLKGTKFEITKNIQVRKRRFIDLSNAFIILPGGFGTFDELFDLLVGKEILNKHSNPNLAETRPIILINYENFFTPFEKLVDHLIKCGFMLPENKKFYKLVKTPKEAIALIKKDTKK